MSKERALAYAVGIYGSERVIREQAEIKHSEFEDFVTDVYNKRPIMKYASYLVCPCGSNYRQEGKEVFCTRKKCYRHTHPLSIQTAKILFLENETQTEEHDKPAGNKAIFDLTGVVKVIMRDNQYV